MQKHSSIPKSVTRYFWDVDIKKLNPSQNPLFVIQRLLDKGDKEAVSWVLGYYDKNTIKKTFTTLRDFKPKVGYFWKLFLNIPEGKVVCLQKPYLKMRKSHWPY
jgi:hypothetical protein